MAIFSRRVNRGSFQEAACLMLLFGSDELRLAQDRGKAIPVGMRSAANARLDRVAKSSALSRLLEQRSRDFRRVVGRSEIANALAIRPEDIPVLVRIFDQSATAERADLEAAHHVAIAIGAADQTEVDLRGARQACNLFRAFVAHKIRSQIREPFPVPADQPDLDAGTDKVAHKQRPIPIAPPTKRTSCAGAVQDASVSCHSHSS